MTALGIHIYAGGFTLGVQDYFNVIAHLENSKFGKKTVEENFPDLPIYDNPEEWPIKSLKRVGIDFIYGNPPCKFFSSAGNRKGQKLADKYGNLNPVDHLEFQSVCFKLQPRIFTFESVPGILTHGSTMLNDFNQKALKYGYAVSNVIMNLKNHGVPQNRRRVFIVAHKVKLFLPDRGQLEETNLTVGKVLKKIKDPEEVALNPLQQKILPKLYDGRMIDLFIKTYGQHTKGRPSFLRRRLDGESLSRVIATHADYFHPYEHRLINPAEAAALCGYPKDYKFVGSQNSRFQQIGAAVLPAAGRFIAQVAANSLRINKPAIIQTETIDLS